MCRVGVSGLRPVQVSLILRSCAAAARREAAPTSPRCTQLTGLINTRAKRQTARPHTEEVKRWELTRGDADQRALPSSSKTQRGGKTFATNRKRHSCDDQRCSETRRTDGEDAAASQMTADILNDASSPSSALKCLAVVNIVASMSTDDVLICK